MEHVVFCSLLMYNVQYVHKLYTSFCFISLVLEWLLDLSKGTLSIVSKTFKVLKVDAFKNFQYIYI